MSDRESLFFDDDSGVVSAVKSFLGIEYDVFVCEHCNEPCSESYTYDPNRAAEYAGKAPSWECPECNRAYVREPRDGMFSIDFYNR